jgi:hypothetical protein
MAVQFKDGAVLFVNGQVAMDPACCECGGEPVPCTGCVTGYGPQRFQVEISGVANGSGCTNCQLYNRTWILNATETACCWESDDIEDSPGCDSFSGASVVLCIIGSHLYVYLSSHTDTTREPPGVFDYYFGSTPPYKIDCLNLDEFEGQPWDKSVPPFSWCDLSNATCKVTSL